jgi:DNA polymerase IIIc chi subunit
LLKFLETELKKLIKTGKKKTATVEFWQNAKLNKRFFTYREKNFIPTSFWNGPKPKTVLFYYLKKKKEPVWITSNEFSRPISLNRMKRNKLF